MTTDPDCIFCKIVAGEIPGKRLFEDEAIIAFEDIHPVAPVHGLIIPKRHVATLDDFAADDAELLGRMMLVARQIANERGLGGYRVAMNVNSLGGQVVFHAHLHVMGGRQMRALG